MHCDAGVMITASHNPKEYNGIKFKSNYGGPFSTEETKKVEALLYHSPVVASPDLIDKQDFTEAYIRHIEQLIDLRQDKGDTPTPAHRQHGRRGVNGSPSRYSPDTTSRLLPFLPNQLPIFMDVRPNPLRKT